ncbi:Lipid A export ATP-binding/permease protein MsbA [hydrothermal vent metagenome]|uniref:Lipid A export ATP-binding/permease protein MsbA n=1 Tax=hydrothermal vent metagenome TaxID=652676 RepID=A0A3B1D031_9ZZZZ
MKKFIFTIVAIFISIFLFLAIGEIMFRIFRGAPNPLAHFSQKNETFLSEANQIRTSYVAGDDGVKYKVHNNQYGYRGKNFNHPKDEGKTRIFLIGDSFTFGVGCEDHQTIPAMVEKLLLEKGFDVEVINAGMHHTSPITHYRNLKNIHMQYEPDMVVLLFDMTDLRDDWQKQRNAVYDEEGNITHFDATIVDGKKDWWLVLVTKSAFAKWTHNKIVRAFKKLKILGLKNYTKISQEGKRAKGEIAILEGITDENVIVEYDGMLMMRGPERRALINKQWNRITAKHISKMHNLLKDKKIPFFIAMYPYGIHVDETQWNEGRKVWGFEQGKVYTDYYPFELVKGYAKTKGIPYINSLENFLKAPKKKYFFDFDGHLTVEGNEIVAQTIVNNLEFSEALLSLEKEK